MASDEEDEFSDADDEPRMRDAGGRGDEDFDEFEDSMANYSGGGAQNTTAVSNQPFDEAVELSESEDNASNASPSPDRNRGAGGAGRGNDARGGRGAADAVPNQPFDEAHDLTSEGSVDDDQSDNEDRDDGDRLNLEEGEHEIPGLAAAQAKAQMGSSTGMQNAAPSETRNARQAAPSLDAMQQREIREPNLSGGMKPQGDDDDDDDDEYGNGGEGAGAPVAEGMYDPAEFANLQVTAEIKELFQYITRYKPHNIELETKMRPFIPDYIPAVGDIDPFIKVRARARAVRREPGLCLPTRPKRRMEAAPRPVDAPPAVAHAHAPPPPSSHSLAACFCSRPVCSPSRQVPRPDGKADNLGLVTLDEPASIQSDPTVLTLQLRAVSKSSGAQPMLVRSVEHAEKDPKAITGWIDSIANLHRHKPAPSVRYSKPMPDIETLMQIWPAPIEELLETSALPDADINLDLASYVRTVCALLDIPVYGSLTEALHVLFTLYSDFKANVHFQQQLATEQQGADDGFGGGGDPMGGDPMGGGDYSPGKAETLSLS